MVLASLFIAFMAKNYFKDNIFKIFITVFIGAVIIFGCGIMHLSAFTGISKAVALGLMPFIYSEVLKIALAVFITYALLKKTKQIN
jgi:biotin transporter BioY